MKRDTISFAIAFILLVMLHSALSPKWMVPLAAWLAPGLTLRFICRLTPWKSWWFAFGAIFISGVVSNYRVMPFPLVVLVPMVLIGSSLTATVYWFARWMWLRTTGLSKTLFLPSIFVLYEFANTFGGGGTWGSIAYSQADQLALIQVISVTGWLGVTFLIYWVNAVLTWCLETPRDIARVRSAFFAVLVMLSAIIGGGTYRLYLSKRSPAQGSVRVATITADNLVVAQALYEGAFEKRLRLDYSQLTQTSPELQELNRGLIAFIEDPEHSKFVRSRKKMRAFQDSLLSLAAKEAIGGSRVISFSEALFFSTKKEEDDLLKRASSVAERQKVYLLLPIATFVPGEVASGRKFMENKVVLFEPSGRIGYTFYKNKPVALVEPSVPGDGRIPVLETDFGGLSTSICYDADFPQLMRQLGLLGANLLILPSGDWREISPYHAMMARFRAIENGCAIVRPVSNATTYMFDAYGRIVGSRDFFEEGGKILVAQVPTGRVTTGYPLWGDVWLLFLGLVIVAFWYGALKVSRHGD